MLRGIKNKKAGFTLIELLIVIAIIGILASIILVTLSSAREKALTTAWKQTMRSISGGIALCCFNPDATLRASPGDDICNSPNEVRAEFPNLLKYCTDIDNCSYTSVQGVCGSGSGVFEPNIKIKFGGLPKSACNNVDIYIKPSGIYRADRITPGFPPGC